MKLREKGSSSTSRRSYSHHILLPKSRKLSQFLSPPPLQAATPVTSRLKPAARMSSLLGFTFNKQVLFTGEVVGTSCQLVEKQRPSQSVYSLRQANRLSSARSSQAEAMQNKQNNCFKKQGLRRSIRKVCSQVFQSYNQNIDTKCDNKSSKDSDDLCPVDLSQILPSNTPRIKKKHMQVSENASFKKQCLNTLSQAYFRPNKTARESQHVGQTLQINLNSPRKLYRTSLKHESGQTTMSTSRSILPGSLLIQADTNQNYIEQSAKSPAHSPKSNQVSAKLSPKVKTINPKAPWMVAGIPKSPPKSNSKGMEFTFGGSQKQNMRSTKGSIKAKYLFGATRQPPA